MNQPKKDKSYYSWLARQQRDDLTNSEISRLPLSQLKLMVDDSEDQWKRYSRILEDSKWSRATKEELEAELRSRNLRAISIQDSILKLEGSYSRESFRLDPDQKKLLSATEKKILVYAGPGAGKTTTLAALAASRRRQNRVIFLVYTKAAQESIIEKIKTHRVSIIPRQRLCRLDYLDQKGIYVLTFHQYGYRRHQSKCNFRQTLSRGIEMGIQSWEVYDLLLVDEVQDITSEHVPLLRQLEKVSEQVVYAGDIRQQLYPGAKFMERVWDSPRYTKYYLRYNHRSTPGLVAMLNRFSRTHFGEQHLEQLIEGREVDQDNSSGRSESSNTPEEEFEWLEFTLPKSPSSKESRNPESSETITGVLVETSPQQVGIVAADYCGHSQRKWNSYCISPVSIRKFPGTSEMVTAIREQLNRNNGLYGKILDRENSYRPQQKVTNIGNSYVLKGTEADYVSVIQADIPYQNYIVDHRTAARLIYVALSRARKGLQVIVWGEIKSDNHLHCISEFLSLQTTKKKHQTQLEIPKYVLVTDDLVESYPLSSEVVQEREILPLPQRDPKAPDFLGILVEGFLCQKMGIPPPEKVKVEAKQGIYQGRSYISGKTLHLILPKKSRLFKFFQKIKTLENEYQVAQARYSIIAGQEWTLGDQFKNDTFPELDDFVPSLRELVGPGKSRSDYYRVPLFPHRSPWWREPVGYLIGITDLESSKSVIEIKHAQPRDQHTRQVLIYSLLSGEGYKSSQKIPVVVNTREGVIQELETPEGYSHLIDFARAKIASKQALYFQKKTTTLFLDSTWMDRPDLMVAVDLEHDQDILEIGAVAFSRGSGEIVDVFHQLREGVRPDPRARPPPKQFEGVGKMCGFWAIGERPREKDLRLVRDFREWIDQIGETVVLEWCGQDSRKLGLKHTGMDVRKLFLRWLEKKGMSRRGETKLSDAASQVLYHGFFSPHRAFEDAVATMGVFLAMVE